jgi:hypothetical protein
MINFFHAVFVAALIAAPAMAQDKKAGKSEEGTRKEITSDDKVRVYEVTYKPGQGRKIEPGHRVVRALKGGTLERAFADGKKEKAEWKEGQVRINKPTQGYTVRNVGKSEIVLYVVDVK